MAEIAISAVALALTILDKVHEYYGRYQGSGTVPVDIDQAKDWLRNMKASLTDSENQVDGRSDLQLYQQYVKHVENTAYDIEDALADYLLHIPDRRGFSQRMHRLVPFLPGNEAKNASRKLSSNMNCIMKKKKENCDKLEAAVLLRLSSSSTRKEDWPDVYLAEGDEIVGFETRNEKLFTQVKGEDVSRLTILIAGPGGSGKSTMVKNIYHWSEKLSENKGFGCRAWVHVPDMEMEKLLLKILDQAQRQEQNDTMQKLRLLLQKKKFLQDEKDKCEENDTMQKLRLLLQKKKFLVVLDNVWSSTDLDYIVKALPNGLPGSKIIITARQSDVTRTSHAHDFSIGLSSANAKDLFCRKAFENCSKDWPSIIDSWATTILNMCEGMPLAISAIGTVLAGKPVVPIDWKKVHDTLGSQMCDKHSDLYVLFRNLQPSYRDLQSTFKTCFLYFSMFPHDYSISQERLIRLWVAEGFVMSDSPQLAEEKAADILDQLTKRNMVVASTVEVDGRLVRRYRVLHLVREINISRGKNFLTVLEQNSNPSGDIIRRLSVNKGRIKIIKGRTSRTRTLLVFELASTSPYHDLEMILKTSKFLRVLDLQGVTALDKFPDHVFGLTLLKYLSLKGTEIKIVPKSIKKLVDLETLDLRQTNVTCLPIEICDLEKLRHLLIFCKDVGTSGGVYLPPSNLAALSSMQKLSRIKVDKKRRILTAVGEIPGLRKLGLTDLQKEDGRELCISIQKMEDLSTLDVRATSKDMYLDLDHMASPLVAPFHLQHLYMEGRLERVPKWIPELTSLKKIGLKWSKLRTPVIPVNPLEPLQDLPSLIELCLVDYCTGEELVFGANTFKELVILRMEQFDELKSMKFGDRAMPQLKKLTMRQCQNLKVLPEGIGGLTLLDEFRYNGMPDEFNTMLQSHVQTFPHILIIRS